MSEEDRRRFSLPSIKAQHVPGNTGGGQDNYVRDPRTPSTYPPAGPRPGQLYPPNQDRGGSSGSNNSPRMKSKASGGPTPHPTNLGSMPVNNGVFSQSGMTESPRPLSPAGMHSHQLGNDPSMGSISRQRSPSLTTQFQQQHFGRRPSGRASPPNMSLPSPHGSSHGPKLPALTNLAPPDTRFTLPSQTPGQPSPANGTQGNPQSQQGQLVSSPKPMYQSSPTLIPNRGGPNSAQSHQRTDSGDNRSNFFAGGERGFLDYVQNLENQVKQLLEKVEVMDGKEKSQEEKINRLSEELFSLRNQLNTKNNTHP